MSTVEDLVKRVRIEGWCVVDGVIPPDEVVTVRESLVATADGRPEDLENGRHALRGIIAYDQAIAPYLSDDRIMGVTEAFFGKHVRISMTTGVILHPGYPRTDDPGGGLHSDWPFGQGYDYRVPAPYPDAPLLLTSLWMLTPFTRENGGTVLVPGSHKAGNNPTGDNSLVPGTSHPSEIQAEGKPGSVLLFDSRTWHINGHNNSDETRMAIIARYAAWWFNLNPIIPGLSDFERDAANRGFRPDDVVPLTPEQYDALPERTRPLFHHIVIGQQVLPS